jgi:Rrf2 family nitric oxide-sensitive transcriptional repressor
MGYPMKLSLFSDYSLRVLMFAALKGESFQLDEVTKAYGISRHHLAKVVQRLAQLGYLETRRGRQGGIMLAKAPEAIRLGRLIRETEDQPVIVECFDPATNTCPINGSCQLKGILGQALREFYAVLDRHTLKDTVHGPHRARMTKFLLGSSPSAA